MWQELREELHPLGLEIVTVGLDALGADACRPYIEAAKPQHPSLIDAHHVMAERFGVLNIPNGVWIDEHGTIVRPAEPAFARPRNPERQPNVDGLPDRMRDTLVEASGIVADADSYLAALRDWAATGAASRYVLSPAEVVARSAPRPMSVSEGQAHFALATQLVADGRGDEAVRHFREAHRLQPDNFSYKRQAWSLASPGTGPFERFWQGPVPGAEDQWPYDSDWLTEVRAKGARNYYPPLDL